MSNWASGKNESQYGHTRLFRVGQFVRERRCGGCGSPAWAYGAHRQFVGLPMPVSAVPRINGRIEFDGDG